LFKVKIVVDKLAPGVHHSGKFLAVDLQRAICGSTSDHNITDRARVGTWLHLVEAVGKVCRTYAGEIGINGVECWIRQIIARPVCYDTEWFLVESFIDPRIRSDPTKKAFQLADRLTASCSKQKIPATAKQRIKMLFGNIRIRTPREAGSVVASGRDHGRTFGVMWISASDHDVIDNIIHRVAEE